MCKRKIQAAKGEIKADLILKNGNIVNVFTGEVIKGDIAILDGYIVGVGDYSNGLQVMDLKGGYVSPGFINTHCHVESSMVTPDIYCREELAWGVTTLITDPHEIANVAGLEGIAYMLESVKQVPLRYYIQLPSCVPATGFEHAGAVLSVDQLAKLHDSPNITGLGEMMNYPGVLDGTPEVLAKLALFHNRIIDGHAPGLTGKELQAYVVAGIHTEHECVSYEEALEKLRAGMAVLVREGSAAKNLADILQGFIANKIDTTHMAFCTDDKHLADICAEGSIRFCIKRAVELGMPSVQAIQMATIQAANIYRLHDVGAIAPGYKADLVVLDNLREFQIKAVYMNGEKYERNHGKPDVDSVYAGGNSVHTAPLPAHCFDLPIAGDTVSLPVICLQKGQITTKKSAMKTDGVETALQCGRLCKIAVIERHHAIDSRSVGLLQGYGLRQGAIATTVAHDSHNLIVVGCNDADMYMAVEEIKAMGGGFVIVCNQKVLAKLPLPIYGLMCREEPETLRQKLNHMLDTAFLCGVNPDIDPFITLSFLALPVIPEIRITDMGLFDVTRFQFVYGADGPDH